MPEQIKPDPSDMEPAEGSRETVNANLDENSPERSRFTDSNTRGNRDEKGAGITNRPLDQEVDEQRELPSRGTAKQEDPRGTATQEDR